MTDDELPENPKSGRRETEEERLDRKWEDLLQELRVMQTGAQLLSGFLLTLPFQDKFGTLDDFQTGLYLGLVLLATLTTAMIMGPVAIHRRLSGRHVKERLVKSAHVLVWGVLTAIALLVTGIVMFIFDMVIDRTWASIAAAVMALVMVTLLVLLPHRLMRHEERDEQA
jgi:drug/metabolite transporter (DMT)-like permease